ncbi:MAG: hypothetical protein HYY18_14255 [Planctomycetes bacterium]|nr:hypothetical protein [Planctomycetota bacterium]
MRPATLLMAALAAISLASRGKKRATDAELNAMTDKILTDYAVAIKRLDALAATCTAPVWHSDKTFTPGGFVGDAQVFEFSDPPRLLGGVPLAATNSKDVMFRHGGVNQNDAGVEAIDKDLADNLERHLCEQLSAAAGVEVPPK